MYLYNMLDENIYIYVRDEYINFYLANDRSGCGMVRIVNSYIIIIR